MHSGCLEDNYLSLAQLDKAASRALQPKNAAYVLVRFLIFQCEFMTIFLI